MIPRMENKTILEARKGIMRQLTQSNNKKRNNNNLDTLISREKKSVDILAKESKMKKELDKKEKKLQHLYSQIQTDRKILNKKCVYFAFVFFNININTKKEKNRKFM